MKKDYTEIYNRISEPFRSSAKAIRFLQMSNYVLELMFYTAYPLLLGWLFFNRISKLPAAILIPGAAFAVVSLSRKRIGRLRPYEELPILPLIRKDATCNSMPSRHVFCSTLISMMYLRFFPLIGVIMLLLSAFEAYVRIVSGVHYPTDTVAGYAIAVGVGIVFMLI